MKTNSVGLRALTTSHERQEIRAIGHKPVRLQYLLHSKQRMGFALWNVLSPVSGYKSGGVNGYPTFSLETLRAKGLI